MTGSRRFAVLLVTVGLILIGPAAGASAGGGCRGANVKPTATNLNLIRTATLCLIDAARASARERGLRSNAALRAVAGHQVAGMVRFDYFSDIRPSGQTPGALIAKTGYAARGAAMSGEDIAYGTGSDATPAQIVNEWLNSPPHREIMLDPAFKDIGVGVIAAVPSFLSGRQHGATYAIEFGARLH